MWRATDLKRAYLTRDAARVAVLLAGLDAARVERVFAWLVLGHDVLFDGLGGPSMSLAEIDAAAALAPPEAEFATTTAVRRIATGETGLVRAVEDLAPLDRIHTIAICTVVMLLEAYGRTGALAELGRDTAEYERTGRPRPYTIP